MSNSQPVLLRAQQISKRFGGLSALSEVSFTIHQGEIYGLLGPNGAGKTTLFNVLTGLYQKDAGEIYFAEQLLDTSAPHRVALAGMARTFQNIRLFANLTAHENILIGQHIRSKSGILGAILNLSSTQVEEKRLRQRADAWLDYVGIAGQAGKLAKQLSYGDQRRLEIARALATEPKLLALDEPAAGMNASETAALSVLLKRIQADGITILLIEHDVKLMMQLCDRIAVLDYGKKIAEDIPLAIQNNPAVIAAYLGTEVVG